MRGVVTGANSRVAQAADTIGAKFHVVELWTIRLINPKYKTEHIWLCVVHGLSDNEVPMEFANVFFFFHFFFCDLPIIWDFF